MLVIGESIVSFHEAFPGDNIEETVAAMLEKAATEKRPVLVVFNEVGVVANPNDQAADVLATWELSVNRRGEAYRRSPEGKAAARKRAAVAKQAAKTKAKGVVPFAIRDRKAWDEYISSDDGDDSYGKAILRYASRWAALMDEKLASGKKLKDIASHASLVADGGEGVTGNMYGVAVGILSQVWEHGEELRKWHNSQYGVSGDGANKKKGVVVNSAMITVRIPEKTRKSKIV